MPFLQARGREITRARERKAMEQRATYVGLHGRGQAGGAFETQPKRTPTASHGRSFQQHRRHTSPRVLLNLDHEAAKRGAQVPQTRNCTIIIILMYLYEQLYQSVYFIVLILVVQPSACNIYSREGERRVNPSVGDQRPETAVRTKKSQSVRACTKRLSEHKRSPFKTTRAAVLLHESARSFEGIREQCG